MNREAVTTATLLVAGGITLSAFWILALNSWMHTPSGFEMIDGQAHVTSWLQVIFNPSFPYRFTHMMLASGLTVAFLVAGISAYRWLRNDRAAEVMASLKTGIYLAALLIPLQIVAGDFHGLNTLEYQPAKLAAMEGIWQTQTSVGRADRRRRRLAGGGAENRADALAVPGLVCRAARGLRFGDFLFGAPSHAGR